MGMMRVKGAAASSLVTTDINGLWVIFHSLSLNQHWFGPQPRSKRQNISTFDLIRQTQVLVVNVKALLEAFGEISLQRPINNLMKINATGSALQLVLRIGLSGWKVRINAFDQGCYASQLIIHSEPEELLLFTASLQNKIYEWKPEEGGK